MRSAAAQSDILDALSRLIAIPSVSGGPNTEIVGFIDAYLRDRGVEARRIEDPAHGKASILATIGPKDRPGVVLSAHTDVVPAEGQAWSSPPFSPRLRDGRVYGRGAADMKGFIAVMLAHVARLKASATATPVHLALSYDEELGCAGAPDLVAAVAGLPVLPAFCIVGEPTGMKVVSAHKGKVARRILFTGRGGHSALPHRAANAAVAASRAVVAIAELAREESGRTDPESGFDPPWTTIHVGSIHGGDALNIVPDRAIVEFEIRSLPGADTGRLLSRIDAALVAIRKDLVAAAPEAAVSTETISSYPALRTPAGHPALGLVGALAGDSAPGIAVSFGTEAGLYSAAGIPTVVCGPGDIARAHRADEWIGLDELAEASRMMERLSRLLARPAQEWMPWIA